MSCLEKLARTRTARNSENIAKYCYKVSAILQQWSNGRFRNIDMLILYNIIHVVATLRINISKADFLSLLKHCSNILPRYFYAVLYWKLKHEKNGRKKDCNKDFRFFEYTFSLCTFLYDKKNRICRIYYRHWVDSQEKLFKFQKNVLDAITLKLLQRSIE